MSLADEITKNVTRKGPACHMGVVEAKLSKRDVAELRSALADSSVTTSAIFRALKGRGFTVNLPGVGKHRRGDCACEGTTR